ncbi:MAG: ABC transporter permease subunit, partial [Microcoleus sp. CAN_BIN18]|nr:ABC transporter permease subunit [Microcoleus sp. CAN_BIN18]
MAASTNRRGGVDVQGALGEFWKKNSSNILPPILGLLGFLLIWQFLSGTGIIKLPPPTSVWTDERTRILLLFPFMNSKTYGVGLFLQKFASLEPVAKGNTKAAAVGNSVGVLVGTNPLLNKALDPIFQFLRMVAPLAWVPIALAALQQNEPAALFVIFITSVWPILINTAEGVRQIPDDYNNVAKVLQLTQKEYY